MRLVILLLLAISQGVFAGEYPFLKVDNPNELQIFVSSASDWLPKTELQETVYQFVRRARIKPVEITNVGRIQLEVLVQGTFAEKEDGVCIVEAKFSVETEGFGLVDTRASRFYYGVDSKSGVIQLVRNAVEYVLDLYLQENFDL